MRTPGHLMADRSHTNIEIENEMYDDGLVFSEPLAGYICDQRSSKMGTAEQGFGV